MAHGLRMGRVNPLVPALVALVGLAVALSGPHMVGAGIAVGAGLALVNGVLLSRRVDMAADTGNVAGALLVMQAGLMVTCLIVGVATVVMVHFSLPMTVASAAGFGITHLGTLAAFYITRGRADARWEGRPS